jgi:PIN domain nuclease of toxin-antitoxin system
LSLLLDTHVLVWWLTPSSPLTRTARSALDAAAERGALRLSAISMWEAQVPHSKGRLQLPLPFPEWLVRATDQRAVSILPLDCDVAIAVHGLPASFHGDPADRLIVATGRTGCRWPHAMPRFVARGSSACGGLRCLSWRIGAARVPCMSLPNTVAPRCIARIARAAHQHQ